MYPGCNGCSSALTKPWPVHSAPQSSACCEGPLRPCSWSLLHTLEVEVSKGIKTRFYFRFKGQILNCKVSNLGLACGNSYVVWKVISKRKIRRFKKNLLYLRQSIMKRAHQSLVSWAFIAIQPITDVCEKVTQDKQIQDFECC